MRIRQRGSLTSSIQYACKPDLLTCELALKGKGLLFHTPSMPKTALPSPVGIKPSAVR